MNKVIIWDADGACTYTNPSWIVLLWRDFANIDHPNAVSIPELVEKDALKLRSRYLKWTHDLGEMIIKGKCLIDYFELHSKCNYWWMTLFNEKCNFSKSPEITDAIKFMALADWLSKNAVNSILLDSHNLQLSKCLRSWCNSHEIVFEWKNSSSPQNQFNWIQYIYKTLPYMVQAAIWMPHYLFLYWPCRGLGIDGWRRSTGRITFISYLLKFDPKSKHEQQDGDRYWGPLPRLLKQEGRQTNWLHIYVKDSLLSNAKDVIDAVSQRNDSAENLENHVALESFLSIDIVFKAVRIWCRIIWLGFRLRNLVSHYIEEKNGINLWPFFVSDWNQSMFGPIALSNAFNQALFSKAFKILPRQRVGIFLQENQGWEFGCIQEWRAENHGQLIGCPHSSVRFWDLRYFFDSRFYSEDKKNTFPRPDFVALNSESALVAYLDAGYPIAELVKVEALRYLYLEQFSETFSLNCTKSSHDFHLLVLGDYLKSNSKRQLEVLERAVKLLGFQIHITFKPHPACPIDLTEFPGLNIVISKEPMAELLAKSSAAYVSPVTSAAIDVYCAGMPVISTLDPNMLNLSPLRGNSEIFFVKSPEQLAKTLKLCMASMSLERRSRGYFIIDSKLPRWRKLLLG